MHLITIVGSPRWVVRSVITHIRIYSSKKSRKNCSCFDFSRTVRIAKSTADDTYTVQFITIITISIRATSAFSSRGNYIVIASSEI